MKIRTRLNVLAVCIMVGMCWSGRELLKSYEQHRDIQTQIDEILDLRGTIVFLDLNSFDPKLSTVLKEKRRQLGTSKRAELVSNIIQAYNEQDPKIMRQRIYQFLKTDEKSYQRALQSLASADKQVKTFASITLGFPLMGLLLLMFLVRSHLFKSLERLNRRMMDFLVDRYSFQFTEPENNEIGAIQRTFNSLAQRVINNMDELKSLDQAKSDFLSIASHELRTPMTSIKGSLSLLTNGVMGKLEPQAEKLLRIAEMETDRLIRLINDLLDLAKIEAGKFPLAGAWVSWDETVLKTNQSLLGLSSTAKVNLYAAPTPHLEVFIDRDRMQQILTNLISNAVKFSPDGGTVYIEVGRTGNGELLVQVRDEGVGIAHEDQELIFQKFRQSSSPENPIVKGTGLGLTIARALVEEHGGTIGVASEKGKGATFYFTLPKWRDAYGSSPEAIREAA